MSWDELSNEEHKENGFAARDELAMLAETFRVLGFDVYQGADDEEISNVLKGASRVLKRVADNLLGLSNRFGEVVERLEMQTGQEG